MTNKIYIDIQLRGEGFSPKQLTHLTKFPIKSIVESGEISKKGRFKGKPSPFGIGLIKIESNIQAISEWCDKIFNEYHLFNEFNVQEIIFDIESNLHNFFITPELIIKLSKINASLNYSTIPNIENNEINFDEILSKIWNDKTIPKHSTKSIYKYLYKKFEQDYKMKNDLIEKKTEPHK